MEGYSPMMVMRTTLCGLLSSRYSTVTAKRGYTHYRGDPLSGERTEMYSKSILHIYILSKFVYNNVQSLSHHYRPIWIKVFIKFDTHFIIRKVHVPLKWIVPVVHRRRIHFA